MRFAADRPLGVAPATVLDYRELARRRLPRQLFDYIDGGAYEETTLRANVADLERVLLRQIVMRDVSTRAMAVDVLGQRLALPGDPRSGRSVRHVRPARRGSGCTCRARHAGVPFTESTVSICSIEEVAQRDLDAAVVSAVRDARPRLRRRTSWRAPEPSARRCSC